jgi:hypothetical protein
MVDYECPACGGGFPASVGSTADACPWCGEQMDGDDDPDPLTPSTPTTEPLHPFWDSGIRNRRPELGTPDPEDLYDPEGPAKVGGVRKGIRTKDIIGTTIQRGESL